MGFKVPIVGGLISGLFGGDKPKASAPAATSSNTSTDDAAKEDERRRMLARGLSPLTATSPLGDLTTANIGRKALMGV